MGWLIFWLIVVAYWAVGIKLLPIYYRRMDEQNAKDYPYSYSKGGMAKSSATEAMSLALFWPYYEAGRWVLNTVIHRGTAEQRKHEEYEKARKIVEDYAKNKERLDQEAFDRKLRGLD
jgi:hypothetical protein